MERNELAHFKQVLKQLEALFKRIDGAYSTVEMTAIEREGSLTIQELQLCAPRLWNDFINSVQDRRRAIARGEVEPPKAVPAPTSAPTTTPAKPKKAKKTTKKGK